MYFIQADAHFLNIISNKSMNKSLLKNSFKGKEVTFDKWCQFAIHFLKIKQHGTTLKQLKYSLKRWVFYYSFFLMQLLL
jgi:hypothetical protein